MILENIKAPGDIKNLDIKSLAALCGEIREKILLSVSKNGGHLSSNLGSVELCVALHKVFDSPDDKFVFDVGHQSYAHKLLTGRQEGFEKLRSDGGVSGFTKRSESEHDPFGSGHSGNALSAAIGLAAAEKLSGGENFTVALIGDGGFTNGMTYEALNNCAGEELKLIIVLNDNEMAISRNVGTIDNIFNRMRLSRRYFRFKNNFVRHLTHLPLFGKPLMAAFRGIKNFFKHIVLRENFFETLGFDYFGSVDGNDIKKLIYIFEQAKKSQNVCVVHAYTKKGKGYRFAEDKPDSYHSVSRFNPEDGLIYNGVEKTFSHNAGESLLRLAEKHPKLCAVSAAMTAGTGLGRFAEKFPERFFDVGIAEEHAVTFCAGLCAGGYFGVFAVYSTFLQRCFDQLAEDVVMQSLPITLLIDRAGLVGDDGVTHHGIFDVSLLNSLPGVLIFSPDSLSELLPCIEKCLSHPTLSAVRYPKGRENDYPRGGFICGENLSYADYGNPEKVIITYGRLAAEAVSAARKHGGVRVIKLLRIKPVDFDALLPLTVGLPALFVEEGVLHGGIGEMVSSRLPGKILVRAISGTLPGHGSLKSLFKDLGLDADSIVELLNEM
ncbi:MAG: 1-deoxy-D-xylulose-5-phosphate synthase [Eubacteriales bacterium]